MIFFLIVIGALSLFAPEPVEPPPEPPPIVETIQATDERTAAKALPVSVKLEAAAGLACIAVPACLGVRLAQAGQRRKRKDTILTDNVQYAALMRRLNDMAAIMEAVKNE